MAKFTFKQNRTLYELAVRTIMIVIAIITVLLLIALIKLAIWIIIVL